MCLCNASNGLETKKKNRYIAQSDMSQSCLWCLVGGQQEVETLRNWSEINNKMEFDININPYELM